MLHVCYWRGNDEFPVPRSGILVGSQRSSILVGSQRSGMIIESQRTGILVKSHSNQYYLNEEICDENYVKTTHLCFSRIF